METPDLLHLTTKDYKHVYEPAEDTFLMLDALESDLALIRSAPPLFVVEIGSGCGVTITALAKALSLKNTFYFAVDINAHACALSQKTALKNHVLVEALNMDLLTNFRRQLFDIIIFNPPYVVTESEEISGTGIERSWSGGLKGREVIDRLLLDVRSMLTKNGVFYLLMIEENDPQEVCRFMEGQGFQSVLVMERKIRGEYLKVFRFNLA